MMNSLLARGFYWLAQAALPLGRGGARLAHWMLLRAVVFDPRLERARGWLYLIEGSFARDRGDIDGAVELLRRCAAILPSSDVAIANLGIALTMAGKHEEAIQVIERSIRGEADLTGESQIWTALAWSYLRSGRAPKALDACDRATESRAASAETEVIRRLAHGVRRGLVHREDLAQRLRAAPRIVPLVLEFCQHLAKTGSRDLARQVLSCFGPSLQERAYLLLARSALNEDDCDTAGWATEEYGLRGGSPVMCATLRAEMALRRGDDAQALQEASAAVARAPERASVREQLVRVRLVTGEVGEASRLAAEAVQLKGAGALAAGLAALDMLDHADSRAARRLFSSERGGDALACTHAHAAQALITALSRDRADEARAFAVTGLREALDLPAWAARPHILERLADVYAHSLELAPPAETDDGTTAEELLAELQDRVRKLQRQVPRGE